MKAWALLLLAALSALPLRAAELRPETGVPALRLVEAPASGAPSYQHVPEHVDNLALPQAVLAAAPVAAAPSALPAPANAGAVPLSQAAAPAAAAPSLSAAPARGPPAQAVAGAVGAAGVRFVAGRDHQAAQGAFASLRLRVLDEVGRNWALPVESLLESADALVLGESHRSLSSYELLAREMPRLKKAGVAAVGLEGLKAPQQDAVDRWLAGPAGAPKPDAAVSFSPARRESVEKLFNAAKEHGLRLVALGSPLTEWAEQVTELAAGNARDLDEGVPADLADQLALAERTYTSGYNEAVSEVVLRRRNAAMARRLAEAAGPGGKAVALVGDAHLDHHDALSYRLFWLPLEAYGSLAAELRQRALRAVSVTLTGGLFVSPAQDRAQHRRIHAASYRLLDEVNPDGRPAFFRTSETTGLLHLGGR